MTDIYCVGNGASLRDFNWEFLKDKEWVGCCLGYRHWEKTGIYPTHYVNTDPLVLKHHIEDIRKLIKNQRCKSFVLCCSVLQYWETIQKEHPNVIFLQQLQRQREGLFRHFPDYCSGTTSCLYGYCLSDKLERLHILGMDCKYVEILPEAIENEEDGSLLIVEPVKNNPNYFTDDYQKVGDVYQKPNVEKIHKLSWKDLRNLIILGNVLSRRDISVYNYNTTDSLDRFFERKPVEDIYST